MNEYIKIDKPFLVHETNFAEVEKVVYLVRPEKILKSNNESCDYTQWSHVTMESCDYCIYFIKIQQCIHETIHTAVM